MVVRFGGGVRLLPFRNNSPLRLLLKNGVAVS